MPTSFQDVVQRVQRLLCLGQPPVTGWLKETVPPFNSDWFLTRLYEMARDFCVKCMFITLNLRLIILSTLQLILNKRT